MKRSLIIGDYLMYGGLLGVVFFLPYSLAIIEICLLTMMLGWVIAQRYRSQKFEFDSFTCSLIAIALLIVFTIPCSHDALLSLKKFFSRFLQQIFLMYLVTQIVDSRKRLYGVCWVLLLTLSLACVDVFIQYLWGKSIVHHTSLIVGRVTGPMNHPNDFGTMLVTVIPLVLVLAIISRKWASGAWIAISILCLLLVNALGFTDSRGAWVALIISMMTLGILLKNSKVLIFIIFFILLFIGVFSIQCINTRVDLNGTLFDSSNRLHYWQAALDVIKKYPWFGCGYNAYIQTLRTFNIGPQEDTHNSLLLITAELGLLGLVLYGWFFTALFLRIKNVLRLVAQEHDLLLLGCGISTGILAWALHSLIDTPWSSFQLTVLWWLFIGLLFSLGRIKKGEKSCL